MTRSAGNTPTIRYPISLIDSISLIGAGTRTGRVTETKYNLRCWVTHTRGPFATVTLCARTPSIILLRQIPANDAVTGSPAMVLPVTVAITCAASSAEAYSTAAACKFDNSLPHRMQETVSLDCAQHCTQTSRMPVENVSLQQRIVFRSLIRRDACVQCRRFIGSTEDSVNRFDALVVTVAVNPTASTAAHSCRASTTSACLHRLNRSFPPAF